jgi:hypothetical protein
LEWYRDPGLFALRRRRAAQGHLSKVTLIPPSI